MLCLMELQLFQHPFIYLYECTISVDGLPVNYTSAEHDRMSTHKNNLLEAAMWGITGQIIIRVRTYAT